MPRRRYAALLAPAFTLQLAADPAAALRHWHGWLENRWRALSNRLHAVCGTGRTTCRKTNGMRTTRPRCRTAGPACWKPATGWIGKNNCFMREHRYSLSGDPPVTHRSSQTIRWIEHGEMLDLLEDCGFRLERFFTDFDPGAENHDPDRDRLRRNRDLSRHPLRTESREIPESPFLTDWRMRAYETLLCQGSSHCSPR